MLRLYRETYFDLNIRHFHEKLGAEHQIKLTYTWVQKALQGAGLVARRSKRRKHRRRRERRPMTRLHTEGATFISAFARNQQNRAYVMRVRFSTRTGVTNQTMFCFKLTDNVQTRYEVIN